MTDDDPLNGLEERLGSLEGRPLAEHADALEEINRVLAEELDRLDGSVPAPDAPAGQAPAERPNQSADGEPET